MRKSFASFVLTLSMLTGSAAFAAEGLFSDVSLNSTVTTPSNAQDSQPSPEAEEPQRLPASEPASELSLALLVAGYQPKEVSQDVVSITMKLDDLSIPVLISPAANGEQLRVTMLLSSLTEIGQIPTATVLKLLSFNRGVDSASFTYNEQLRQIELHKLMPAAYARTVRLRDELDGLAAIAKKTEKLWNIGQMVTTVEGETTDMGVTERPKLQVSKVSVTITPASPQPQTEAGAPAAPVSAPAPNLTGAWTAEISQKDAFALLIKADGSFALVHVKNSKKTQTSGKATFVGSLLTLTSSDGTKLAGSVTLKSAKEFEFRSQNSPASSKPLTFKKAK